MAPIACVFGVDVGTRTTVISFINPRQGRTPAEFKWRSDARIPSVYHRGRLDLPERDAGGNFASVDKGTFCLDFKPAFWTKEQPTVSDRDDLQGWLVRVRKLIEGVVPPDASTAFCFTYPAQRQHLLGIYRELIRKAGFSADRLEFVDEPTAAVFAQLDGDLPPHGIVLLVDVGAGTTDYTLVDRKGSAGISVRSSSSINVAGNHFTVALLNLLKAPAAADAFENWHRGQPFAADIVKETMSTYYGVEDQAENSFTVTRKSVGSFTADSLADFAASAEIPSRQILDAIARRMERDGVALEELVGVVLCGGGALHAGLQYHLRARFPNALLLLNEPQFHVARGATLFAAERFLPAGPTTGPELFHLVKDDVDVRFPISTGQPAINLLRKNTIIPVMQPFNDKAAIALIPNFVDPEGPLELYVGGVLVARSEALDIKWGVYGQWKRFLGHLLWTYRASTGLLSLRLTLDDVNATEGRQSLECQLEQVFTVAGTYTDVGD